LLSKPCNNIQCRTCSSIFTMAGRSTRLSCRRKIVLLSYVSATTGTQLAWLVSSKCWELCQLHCFGSNGTRIVRNLSISFITATQLWVRVQYKVSTWNGTTRVVHHEYISEKYHACQFISHMFKISTSFPVINSWSNLVQRRTQWCKQSRIFIFNCDVMQL